MTAALKGVSGQQHAPASHYPQERPGTHFSGGWVGPRAGLNGRKMSSPPGFFLPPYFYSGTLRTFQHIYNRYCQHRSWSQIVKRRRDIITPPHHRAFRSTSLSYNILVVHLARISLPTNIPLHKNAILTHFAAHVQHWVTSVPPPNGSGTAYTRKPLRPCGPRTILAWVDFRPTPIVAKAL